MKNKQAKQMIHSISVITPYPVIYMKRKPITFGKGGVSFELLRERPWCGFYGVVSLTGEQMR